MSVFQKLLLITGMLLVITLTANIFLLLTKKYIVQYTYLPSDIMRVDYDALDIYFEEGGDPIEFENLQTMQEYIEEVTAYQSSVHGYKDNLDYLIRQGYIVAITVYNDDEQYTELRYNGPNWTVNAEQDTSYIISTFNIVEKIYDPKKNLTQFESYCID